ncbi:helix-turn-helix domain-containing protein [bacterium]|nr:helix-turn-helix domain-containing protein [bacterium]
MAKEHSCGERTVWRMIDEGKLPAVRFRRCTRVRESDVLDYIRRCQKGEAV